MLAARALAILAVAVLGLGVQSWGGSFSGGGGAVGPTGATGATGAGGAAGVVGLLFPFTISLPNTTPIRVLTTVTNTATQNDLYTVPANRRALVIGANFYNSSGSGSVISVSVKIGGSYYVLQTPANLGAAGVMRPPIAPFIGEPGDIFAISVTNQPVNVGLAFIEFDNTGAMYSPRLTTLIAGFNTVYTVPVGKTAIVGDPRPSGVQNAWAFSNNTVGALTTTWYVVPSGGSPGVGNQMIQSASQGAATASITTNGPFVLSAGDFVSFTSGSAGAGQMVWTVVTEQ